MSLSWTTFFDVVVVDTICLLVDSNLVLAVLSLYDMRILVMRLSMVEGLDVNFLFDIEIVEFVSDNVVKCCDELRLVISLVLVMLKIIKKFFNVKKFETK